MLHGQVPEAFVFGLDQNLLEKRASHPKVLRPTVHLNERPSNLEEAKGQQAIVHHQI
jgi:hypothetical protein